MTDQGQQPAQIAGWLRAQLGAGAQLTGDSRMVSPGDAFVALPGGRSDGRDFIAQALELGARAVLWDDVGLNRPPPALDAWPQVLQRCVPGLRAVSGPIAAEFYGRPSEQLDLIAVTGTNGKTSCTQWLAHGYQSMGRRAAVIGTLGSGPIDKLDPFGLTTPDALRLQRMLAGFVAQGISVVAAEASSIGLHQGRFDGVRVCAAVFTNLTQDHLDYHRTMAEYLAAKARLFAWPGLRCVVVNGDDPAAAAMLTALAEPLPTRIAYGLKPLDPALKVDGRLIAELVEPRADGVSVAVGGDFGRARVTLGLLGHFNVSNALAVAATWIGLGMPFDQAMVRLAGLRPVRGRMQVVGSGIDSTVRVPLVVVDYAHTPDALTNVLQTLRPVAQARGGQLWCLFGAGGDRDPGKRPLMGAAVQALADRAVVTSDNPRSEAPMAIISDLRSGLSREPYRIEPDRARAIAVSIEEAASADVVLIAGKGHEEYQEIDGRRLPFSDVDEARRALDRRRGGARHG